MGSRDDTTRDREPLGDQLTGQHGDKIGQPRQPVTDEHQHMPETGNVPVPGEDDLMEEARDGFIDRYPPRGQTT
jgi:hypothetical protein